MKTEIVDQAKLHAAMCGMNYAAMQELSAVSGVPFHTIRKIRDGETKNSKVGTVLKLWAVLGKKTRGGAKS